MNHTIYNNGQYGEYITFEVNHNIARAYKCGLFIMSGRHKPNAFAYQGAKIYARRFWESRT